MDLFIKFLYTNMLNKLDRKLVYVVMNISIYNFHMFNLKILMLQSNFKTLSVTGSRTYNNQSNTHIQSNKTLENQDIN